MCLIRLCTRHAVYIFFSRTVRALQNDPCGEWEGEGDLAVAREKGRRHPQLCACVEERRQHHIIIILSVGRHRQTDTHRGVQSIRVRDHELRNTLPVSERRRLNLFLSLSI